MYPMRMTNKQIQEAVNLFRKTLKGTKSITGAVNVSYQLSTEAPKATLIITPVAYKKIMSLVDECNKEIAWHGTVIKQDNTYTIQDIYVFPQTVTGATVTSDETEYSMWLMQQPDEIFNHLRFHGHSHVNMGVTPSGVDTTYQQNVVENLNDFYIFGIFNKRENHWFSIYDVEKNLAYTDKDINVIIPKEEKDSWAKDMIKQFVKDQSYKPQKQQSVQQYYRDTVNKQIETRKALEAQEDDDDYEYLGRLPYGGYYGQK